MISSDLLKKLSLTAIVCILLTLQLFANADDGIEDPVLPVGVEIGESFYYYVVAAEEYIHASADFPESASKGDFFMITITDISDGNMIIYEVTLPDGTIGIPSATTGELYSYGFYVVHTNWSLWEWGYAWANTIEITTERTETEFIVKTQGAWINGNVDAEYQEEKRYNLLTGVVTLLIWDALYTDVTNDQILWDSKGEIRTVSEDEYVAESVAESFNVEDDSLNISFFILPVVLVLINRLKQLVTRRSIGKT